MSTPIVQTDDRFCTTLHFDWRRPPLTENQRHHWRKKAQLTKDVRLVAKLAAARIPHFARIEVELTWVVKDFRRRDDDNITPTMKALCDGLVDADVVDDDTNTYMVKRMPQIRVEKGATPHLELTIREVPA